MIRRAAYSFLGLTGVGLAITAWWAADPTHLLTATDVIPNLDVTAPENQAPYVPFTAWVKVAAVVFASTSVTLLIPSVGRRAKALLTTGWAVLCMAVMYVLNYVLGALDLITGIDGIATYGVILPALHPCERVWFLIAVLAALPIWAGFLFYVGATDSSADIVTDFNHASADEATSDTEQRVPRLRWLWGISVAAALIGGVSLISPLSVGGTSIASWPYDLRFSAQAMLAITMGITGVVASHKVILPHESWSSTALMHIGLAMTLTTYAIGVCAGWNAPANWGFYGVIIAALLYLAVAAVLAHWRSDRGESPRRSTSR